MKSATILTDICSMFPGESKEDIDYILSLIPDFCDIDTSSHFEEIKLNGKKILIYERTYFLDNLKIHYRGLNKNQKIIIDCLNTTQSNGYEREKSLKRIIKHNKKYIPYFVLRLLGDFVVFMQDTIYENKSYLFTQTFKDFILENKEYYNLIKQRIISYWNEYYRDKYPNIEKCPGYTIIKELENKKHLGN